MEGDLGRFGFSIADLLGGVYGIYVEMAHGQLRRDLTQS